MSKQTAGTEAGFQATRRSVLRSTAGMVAAGLVGGAMLHNQAGSAQAVERDLAAAGNQGVAFAVNVEGASQGTFAAIQGLGFYYQVGVEGYQNGSSGNVYGLHRHGDVVITKEWNAATPQLFKALVTGEHLNQVVFEFADSGGGVYQRVSLNGARVVKLEQYMHFNAQGHTIGDDPRQLEDVAFSFNQITIENLDGKTAATDGKR